MVVLEAVCEEGRWTFERGTYSTMARLALITWAVFKDARVDVALTWQDPVEAAAVEKGFLLFLSVGGVTERCNVRLNDNPFNWVYGQSLSVKFRVRGAVWEFSVPALEAVLAAFGSRAKVTVTALLNDEEMVDLTAEVVRI